VQPSAFGVVDRDARLRTARHHVQRQTRRAATPIPQRGIHHAQRDARDRADRSRVREKEQILPDFLDVVGVLTEQARRHAIAQQCDYGRAAVADGIGIARAFRAVVADEAQHRRLLRGEALNGVAAHDLGLQVDLENLDARYFRHEPLSSFSCLRRF
jgi:hypothetical protein